MKLLTPILLIVAGCEGLSSPPQPLVSVLKEDGGCFALMTQQTIDPILGVTGTCAAPEVNPQLLAGIDRVEVVIDYGPDVDFDSGTDAPPPSVTLDIDGTASNTPITLSAEHQVGSRVYFVATFTTPATTSTDVQITAGVNAGFTTTVSALFAIVLPSVALVIDDCAGAPLCTLTGAVGSAHFTISVPGDVSQTVLVHATLDGIPQPDPVPPVITQTTGSDYTSQTTAAPVPAAHDGAIWVLEAQLGAQPPSTASVTITAPTIAAQLSCGNACNVATGDSIGLEITAPALIFPLEALVDTTIDGVPQLIDEPVPLVANADGTATGLVTLVAPATAGTWQINVSVAGYPAPAFVTTVN